MIRQPIRVGSMMVAATLAAAVAQAAKPVARVTEVQGNVTVRDAQGAARTPVVYGSVYEAEEITLEPGSSLTLAFRSDGHIERLKSPAKVTLSATGAGRGAATETVAPPAVPKAKMAQWVEEMPQTVIVGGVSVPRGSEDSPPRLLPIVKSTVPSTRPQFSWPPVEKATGYRIIVKLGDDPVWTGKTNATSLAYTGRSPLKEGLSYTWKVSATWADRGPEQVYSGEFNVAGADVMSEAAELQTLAKSDDLSLLAIAAWRYAHHQMFAEALPIYERLAARQPQSTRFEEDLVQIYRRAGRCEDADAAEKRLAELTANKNAAKKDK